MNINEYLEKIKEMQNKLLCFIESENDDNSIFQEFQTNFEYLRAKDIKHNVSLLLHLLAKISENHHHVPFFFSKIEKILTYYIDDIKNNFSHLELFNIFKGNKRILLFLIENKIILINDYIARKFTKGKYLRRYYPQYFLPEILPFTNHINIGEYEKEDQKYIKNFLSKDLHKKLPANFNELRKSGENESRICQLIRDNLIDDFIIFVNQNNVSLDSTISQSIYETNSFLLIKHSPMDDKYKGFYLNNNNVEEEGEKNISLIEYATFFGSIDIVKYLHLNNIQLTQSMWLYAIHSNNPQMINFLEENNVEFDIRAFDESIKCHHNDVSFYLENNYIVINDSFILFLKNYNFAFLSSELINESNFYLFCKYDYGSLVNFFVFDKNISVNEIT